MSTRQGNDVLIIEALGADDRSQFCEAEIQSIKVKNQTKMIPPKTGHGMFVWKKQQILPQDILFLSNSTFIFRVVF